MLFPIQLRETYRSRFSLELVGTDQASLPRKSTCPFARSSQSNLEEDAYRWRTGRMADRGYVDYYDALRIYVPATTQQAKNAHASISDDQPVVVHWIAPLSHGASRLENALAAVNHESLDAVQSSLALAINMALSADRVELWDEEHQKELFSVFRQAFYSALKPSMGRRPPRSQMLRRSKNLRAV